MSEVDKAILPDIDQELRGPVSREVVPAHVRGLDCERKVFALPWKDAEAFGFRRFLARLKEPLHADANAEERHFPFDAICNGISHASCRQYFRRGKVPD